ncbi:MAG: hypothetical protein JST04_01985 [Bdellovibrionales bacterium]|nr:hypothetical protein [Bdellovibrionales bacterium]
MKTLYRVLALSLLAASPLAHAAADRDPSPPSPKFVYGLHLFFDEKEYVDVLTLRSIDGKVAGHMSVPNDFEGDLENVVYHAPQPHLGIRFPTIEFDLRVPKNKSRPQDMTFHYAGEFFNGDLRQLSGFVSMGGGKKFVASFVAFLRK